MSHIWLTVFCFVVFFLSSPEISRCAKVRFWYNVPYLLCLLTDRAEFTLDVHRSGSRKPWAPVMPCGGQQSHFELFAWRGHSPRRRNVSYWRGWKKSRGTTPVYNNRMEPKWSNRFCQRLLLTGFTLCVGLGKCWKPHTLNAQFEMI